MLLDEPKLSELLPSSLTSDEKILAAAKFLDGELAKLSGAIKQVLHLPRLDELPSNVLDYLAWQYHVDNYAANYSNEIKRKMIRESIYLHRIKGTPAAVSLALKAFSDNAEISEWHEYNGKPYFFKIILHDLTDVGDNGEALMRSIYDAKNIRSWLEGIEFDYSTTEPADDDPHGVKKAVDLKVFHAALELQGGDVTTDLSFEDSSDAAKNFHSVVELGAGDIFVDIDVSPDTISADFSTGILEMAGGIEITEADLLSPDEPLIEDDEQPAADFLKLYFGFPNNSLRALTLLNPRKNILPIEVKLLSKFSAAAGILLNRQGEITDGIRRALLITKTEEVIL